MLGNDIFITVSIVTIFRNSDSVVLAFFPFHQPYYGEPGFVNDTDLNFSQGSSCYQLSDFQ